MLTKTTTRLEYIVELEKIAPSNKAVAEHLEKIRAMDERQWRAHREHLLEMGRRFAPEARRMAEQLVLNRGDRRRR